MYSRGEKLRAVKLTGPLASFLPGGSARYLEILKARYVTGDYAVLPFKDLYALAYDVQGL